MASQSPPALAWASALLMTALLVFYAWLATRSTERAILTTQPFGIPDALCAGTLALWMITVIAHSFDAPQTISVQAIVANAVLYGSLILGIFGVIGLRGQSAITLFQLQPARFPKAALSGLLWLLITYPLILITQETVQQFTGSADDSQLIVRYFLEHPDLRHRGAVILMAVIVAPVAEEIIFRGYFYGVIRRFGGRIPALLTSSLLFAAIHVHLPSVPGLCILAMILCLLYERTGSLWAPMVLHAAFNASTIVFLILWPELAK